MANYSKVASPPPCPRCDRYNCLCDERARPYKRKYGWEQTIIDERLASLPERIEVVRVEPEPTPKLDLVNSPKHYTWLKGLEAIDLTEQFSFNLGNALKYIIRCDHKGDAKENLRKAIWYLEREVKRRG